MDKDRHGGLPAGSWLGPEWSRRGMLRLGAVRYGTEIELENMVQARFGGQWHGTGSALWGQAGFGTVRKSKQSSKGDSYGNRLLFN